jgi:hypothetical protein
MTCGGWQPQPFCTEIGEIPADTGPLAEKLACVDAYAHE